MYYRVKVEDTIRIPPNKFSEDLNQDPCTRTDHDHSSGIPGHHRYVILKQQKPARIAVYSIY